MQIIVTIPAFNEEHQIASVIHKIPRKILDYEVKVLVVDDGSSDNTVEQAKLAGADYVYSHSQNLGVARTFMSCLQISQRMNADIVVNIDADNQFNPQEIPNLVEPIVNKQADVVLGSRFIDSSFRNIPLAKRVGNLIIGWIVSIIISQRIRDTQCGFRAMSKDAVKLIQLSGLFTYTQEMILALSFQRAIIIEIPISVKYFRGRKSRVVKSIPKYAFKSIGVILTRTLIHFRKRLLFFLLIIIVLMSFYWLQ